VSAAKQQQAVRARLKKLAVTDNQLLKAYQQHKKAIVKVSKTSGREPPVEALSTRQQSKFTPAVAMARSEAKLDGVHASWVAIGKRLESLRLQRSLLGVTGILTTTNQPTIRCARHHGYTHAFLQAIACHVLLLCVW
jgi:hypothetical protein